MNKIFQQINLIRGEFPILKNVFKPTLANNMQSFPLVYFDNGATTQKPQSVIDSINAYYSKYNSNIHRGKHSLSDHASQLYDNARTIVANQINAHPKNIIFTKGTTESLNLVAFAFANQFVKKDDVVMVSEMEHHSNFIPFQVACSSIGAKLVVIPITDKGDIDMVEYQNLIKKYNNKIKLISVCHISNVLGTINPIKEIIDIAHKYNIAVCIDAAQSIAHSKINVTELDCDFLAFSGHKAYAPTGIGVLFAKEKYQLAMQPYQFGGGMIKTVSLKENVWAEIPDKFEAGTPNIEGAIALGIAFNFINRVNVVNIYNYEKYLTDYTISYLRKIPHIKIIGEPEQRASIVSYTVDGYDPADICSILNLNGIAVRTGYLCAIPLMERLKLEKGVVRVSFAVYNTENEIKKMIYILSKLKK